MDIFGLFIREISPPVTLAGRGLNTITLTAASCNFSLPSLGIYTSVQILVCTIKSFRNQHMHYILISKSITPTHVSAFNKPSSGGQSFTYALHPLVQF
jgi:hypothetical protein